METNIIYNKDCLAGLRKLPANSVDCCVTSPPYYGLRDYGNDGQIGLEDTPEEYIARLSEVFDEVRRVLKPAGTLWLNIGDSYAGSGKGAAAYPENAKKYKQGTNRGCVASLKISYKYHTLCKKKDLIGIPWMLAFSLRAQGWYLRQDIIWHKPNPMPESVTDRCTKSHEYIFLLSKSPRYYFDSEAIKEPAVTKGSQPRGERYKGRKYSAEPDKFYRTKSGNAYAYGEKRNKRDVWEVPVRPFSEAHFAVYPEELIQDCIKAGCPEGGIVLDPFMGAGTTGLVAARNGRKYIGFELNAEYISIANKRISDRLGLFAALA